MLIFCPHIFFLFFLQSTYNSSILVVFSSVKIMLHEATPPHPQIGDNLRAWSTRGTSHHPGTKSTPYPPSRKSTQTGEILCAWSTRGIQLWSIPEWFSKSWFKNLWRHHVDDGAYRWFLGSALPYYLICWFKGIISSALALFPLLFTICYPAYEQNDNPPSTSEGICGFFILFGAIVMIDVPTVSPSHIAPFF